MDDLEGQLETATRMYLQECTDHRATLEAYKHWRARAEASERVVAAAIAYRRADGDVRSHAARDLDAVVDAYVKAKGGDAE